MFKIVCNTNVVACCPAIAADNANRKMEKVAESREKGDCALNIILARKACSILGSCIAFYQYIY